MQRIFPSFKKIIVTIYFVCVLVFYMWISSTSYHRPFQFYFSKNLGAVDGGYHGEHAVEYYNALSDAFLAGQLHLLIKPRDELLALPDPYDPALNRRYRLHDASLYQGKYYLYFGPVPALVFFIPFRLIFHVNLPQDLAIALLGFGGFIWIVLMLHFFIKTYLPKTPFYLFLIAIVCSSFCNVIPFISRRPEVYEVAISSGYFCLMAAFYWLISGAFGGRTVIWRLFMGSLFLGLAVGCRFHFILGSVFIFLAWWKILKEQHNFKIIKSFREFIFLFAPFLVCLILLLSYNYARFGSFWEFGITCQLAGIDLRKTKLLNPAFIIPNFYFYLIQPCFINLRFPFFRLMTLFPLTLPKEYLYTEPVAGVFTNVPFLNILFIFPLFYKKMEKLNKYFPLLTTFFILDGCIIITFLICFGCGSATMRYLVDFMPFLLLPSFLFWFFLNNYLKNNKPVRFTLNIVMIASIVYGCLFNIFISFTGYYDNLNKANPELYNSIAKFLTF